MSTFDYSQSPYPVREDLAAAYRHYWQVLARPGNWWSGAERIAIAQEVRNATSCDYCRQRRQALSPYNFPGQHSHGEALPDVAVDAVHRIITDQSRITRQWIEQQDLTEEEYVELLGVAVTVFSIDEFNRGLGLPLESLPVPEPGAPDHYRPSQASPDCSFVAMIPPQGATGDEADLWQADRTANVVRALSLVPDAVRGWIGVSTPQYLSPTNIGNFSLDQGRSINRLQIELVAGRVSSHNECFY